VVENYGRGAESKRSVQEKRKGAPQDGWSKEVPAKRDLAGSRLSARVAREGAPLVGDDTRRKKGLSRGEGENGGASEGRAPYGGSAVSLLGEIARTSEKDCRKKGNAMVPGMM